LGKLALDSRSRKASWGHFEVDPPRSLSQRRLKRTKVGGRTMIRESELQKVIEDGGKSPSLRRER